jgi:hypothetical protein
MHRYNQDEVQAKERGSMNEDTIATLSDQVMKLMAEIEQLKQRR